MITADGRRYFRRYFANRAGSVIGAISIGAGSAAPTLNDDRMQFEFYRVPITLVEYDFVDDRLIVKASFPEESEGVITEVGLWTSETNPVSANQASTLLCTFQTEEGWTPSTYDATNFRVGNESLKHTPAASGMESSVRPDISLDLSQYSSADRLVLAYNVQNNNTASIKFRFRVDATNYYEFSIANPATGYAVTSILKANAVAVGVPSWDMISDIEVITTSKASGSSSVLFDGLRIEDYDSETPEYGMLARWVLAEPVTKSAGIVQDLEYSLRLNI